MLWGCQCLLTSKPEPMRGMGLTCHICGDLIYKKWIVFLGLAFWTTEVGGQRGSQGSLLSSCLQAFASFWAWPAPVSLPDSSSSHSGSESHGLKQFVSGCRPSLLSTHPCRHPSHCRSQPVTPARSYAPFPPCDTQYTHNHQVLVTPVHTRGVLLSSRTPLLPPASLSSPPATCPPST